MVLKAGMKRRFCIHEHEHTAGAGSKQEAVETTHTTSLSTLDVITPVYIV